MPLLALAHPPRQRQGAPWVDPLEPQRDPPAPDDTAIDDPHQRLQGQRRPQDLRLGQKGDVLWEGVVVHPSGQALDATLGLGALGHVRRDVGQWGALAGHDAAEEGGQGSHGLGQPPWGLTWGPLGQGIPYGTLRAEVVTPRLLLLDGSRFPARVYDEATA